MRRLRLAGPVRALATTLLVLLALAAQAASSPIGYYPAKAGLSWTYSSGETQQMSGPRKVDGHEVMVLTHYLKGVPVSEDYLQYGPDGVKTLGTAANGKVTFYPTPLTVYPPAPLKPGMQWQSTTKLASFDITLSAEVVGVRGVKTQAGRFNALLIHQRTLTSNGASTVMNVYFVPSVGIVRFVTADGTTIDLIDKNF